MIGTVQATDTTTYSSGMAGNLIHRTGGAIKTAVFDRATKAQLPGDGWVEGYLVSWGNADDTDLQGEHFTPRTEFCLDWFKDRPVLYHHGLDGKTGLRKIGTIKNVEIDDMGLWVQAQLDLRDKYAQAVYDMVKSAKFGWSSGSVDHLVKIADNGEITVWPLIEGSITPTPAQPSKTTVRHFSAKGLSYLPTPTTSMRAFKAVLSGDATSSRFLRELDSRFEQARVGDAGFMRSTKSFDIASDLNGTKNLVRQFARTLGLKLSPDEIESLAADLEPDVDAMIANAAAAEVDTEAVLSALEENVKRYVNLKNEEESTMANRRTRSRRAFRNYGYRNADENMMDDMVEDVDGALADEMESIAADLVDEVAKSIDEEMKADLEDEAVEKRAARALRRRIMRRAIRQLEGGTDDTVADVDMVAIETGGVGDDGYLGDASVDSPPIDNFKARRRQQARRQQARRGYSYREVEPDEAMMDDMSLDPEETSVLIEGVASRAYSNGLRQGLKKGLAQAWRNTDELGDADAIQVGPDGDYPESPQNADAEASRAFQRGYRNALRKAQQRRRAMRQLDDELDPTAMFDEEAIAADDFAQMTDDFDADDIAGQYDPMMTDDFDADDIAGQYDSVMTDDADEDDMKYARRSNRRPTRSNGRKSMNYNYARQADAWRQRAIKAELAEAPNQRSFGVSRTRDVADRQGAYKAVFMDYLRRGENRLTPTQMYILEGKGKVDWRGTKSFDSPFGVDPRVKAYTGGSDASVGFAVPPDWVSELNKNVMTQTVMAPECRTRTTTSDRIVQPNLVTSDARRAHAANVRWPGEVISSSAEHRTTEDTYSQIDVPIHVMLLSLPATNVALEDVTFNLEEEINEAFSEAVAVSYDTLIWAGDGQGKLQGIVVDPLVTTNRSTGMSTVSGYVPTGSPDGLITADALKDMLFHLPRGYRAKAKWYMNSNTGLELSKLKDANGNYLIDNRDESIQVTGIPDKLLGRPIVYNEYADDIAENAFPVVFGDLERGYIIGKRVDFSIRRFDDSQYAEVDQVLFLGRARIGGQVLTPAAMKVLKVSAS